MEPFNIMTPEERERYDCAATSIRITLGSYEKIARKIYQATGQEISYQTVRDWFIERRVPEKYAFVLWDVTERNFPIFALTPWLKGYVPALSEQLKLEK